MKFTTCADRPLMAPCQLPTHEFQIDPYVGCAHLCHYCYALNQAETDWSEEIQLHRDLENRLARELDQVEPQRVYMGYETDPYQPGEAEHEQTRTVLGMLLSRGFSASILTKSDLVVRDLDILTAMPDAAVSFSLAFIDDSMRRVFEARTLPTGRRMDALRQCKRAGLRTSAMVCPVIPYLTDPVAIIEQIRHDADKVWVFGLSVREETESNWQTMQGLIEEHFPSVAEKARQAIFDRDHPYWAELRAKLEDRYASELFELSVHL